MAPYWTALASAMAARGQICKTRPNLTRSNTDARKVRWSRFLGQFGGKAKMDSGFDYAASFSSVCCIA
jgi:hypothetical protein